MKLISIYTRASISTAIRFPYLASYENPENQLRKSRQEYLYFPRSKHANKQVTTDEFGIMCIWTMLECGLGIIAGSLPSLRPLLKKLGFTTSSKSYGAKRTGETPATGSRSIPLSQMRSGHTAAIHSKGGGEWERIDDNSSQRNIIMKNTEVDIKWSEGSTV